MKFTKVPNSQRSAFPSKYFNNPIFDTQVFNIADQMMKDYTGGTWDYVTSDEGVAFMRLNEIGDSVLVNPFSGEEVATPNIIAGMILTSFAMLMQIEKGSYTESFLESYYKLKDAIADYCSDIGRTDIWMGLMD